VHPDKAKDTMNQSVELLKREKIKLWVFPEGESSLSLMGFQEILIINCNP
jgi:1-acyl-sn-glycerol-3-phosphate acyltransferase